MKDDYLFFKMATKNGKSREAGNSMYRTQNMDNKIKKYVTQKTKKMNDTDHEITGSAHGCSRRVRSSCPL